jgi:hypothetical protein
MPSVTRADSFHNMSMENSSLLLERQAKMCMPRFSGMTQNDKAEMTSRMPQALRNGAVAFSI